MQDRPRCKTRRATRRLTAVLVFSSCLIGCLQEGRDPPVPAGPSALALSIRLRATPDVLPIDGAATSVVAVTATRPDRVPAADLRLAVRIVEGSTPHDAGELSARSIVTDTAGHAVFSYRAPRPSGNAGRSVDPGRVVTLVVIPVTGDFSNAVERRVRIRLVPAGIVIPPFDVQPGFEVTPVAPAVSDQVRFSAAACPAGDSAAAACTRDPLGLIADYRWDFGDGGRASGRMPGHVFSTAGTYLVRMTVTDAFDRSAEATRTVPVAAGKPPTASFVVSPVPVAAGEEVFFDASASAAAEGRRLVSHEWSLGDGATGRGVATSHAYREARTYTVTVNVTDDTGLRGSAAGVVEVVDSAPVAVVTASPAAPAAGETVHFSAERSTAAPGRRIVRYRWRFGDGREGMGGPTASHAYAGGGDYLVEVAVTDDDGRTGRASIRVVVE